MLELSIPVRNGRLILFAVSHLESCARLHVIGTVVPGIVSINFESAKAFSLLGLAVICQSVHVCELGVSLAELLVWIGLPTSLFVVAVCEVIVVESLNGGCLSRALRADNS